MPDSRRVFFALWPDEDVARQFEEAGRQAHRALGGRCMRRDTLHLTLAFVGETTPERLAALRGIAEAIRLPAFDLSFDRGQCLARKRIFWAAAGRIPEALRELAAALARQLDAAGFRTEDRPFAAHVTLLRHARCDGGPPPGELCIAWPVRDFVLVESDMKPQGARYRIIGRWPLITGNWEPATASQT
ncbi:MAG: RNA 2',3'-cyclic phosphodiesterase [Betaproteobacteria bacterium]|nr:RNA 2',3'-cyclic phosphodiesterase [Betaproteobacteria bacterium]